VRTLARELGGAFDPCDPHAGGLWRAQTACKSAVFAYLIRFYAPHTLVEPVIAHVKHLRRLDRLLLRGISGAEIEWTLACTAHNLTLLARTQAAAA
jgi:hypothetical protein